jgi:hypothetical protein
MFNTNDKAKEQDLKRKMERSEREQILQMEEKKIGLLEKISILVEQKLIEEKESKQEISKITFNSSHQTFETKGYRFNTLVVSENYNGVLLEIEYNLERFDFFLNSGFNRLNLPNGCTVKSKDGTTITATLILSKEAF